MAAGRPVIAFDVSSNHELIEHGDTGFLVPALNIDAFAERIIQLARDGELRAGMGLKGQARVCEMFDQAAQLNKLEAFLCEEVLGR
jgi:glycosyltransferase involved in cell wall biosynthesis